MWSVEDKKRVWTDPETGKKVVAGWYRVERGEIPLEALEIVELKRGGLMNHQGNFHGTMPGLSASMRRRINQELIRRAQNQMTDNAQGIVNRPTDIALNSADEKAAVRAGTDLLDRIGVVKKTAKQEVSIEHKFENTLAKAVSVEIVD